MKQNVTGIILAGGSGRRMGMEKGLATFRGKAMIKYALEALAPLCDEILISANTGAYDHLGYRVIADELQDSGPMGGIYSCLRQSENETNFVLTCDMPLVDKQLVTTIIGKSSGFDICVPWHGGNFFEPLCAVYKKSLLQDFAACIAQQNFRIPDLINKVTSNKLRTGTENGLNPHLFFNVNSKKDLEQLNQQNGDIRNKHDDINKRTIPNLLMIAGTGRNVGKTTMACNLISHFSKPHPVTAIKVSPHLHQQAEGQKIIALEEDFQIIEETKSGESPDSSRMLNAGAQKVYYLQTRDRNIRAPFEQLLNLIPKDRPVICESGALLSHTKPGLFVLIKRDGQTAFKKGLDKLNYQPDAWITFYGDRFSVEAADFVFENNRWQLTSSGQRF